MTTAVHPSTRLAIYGAAGRMGLQILQAAAQRTDCFVAAALVRAESAQNGAPPALVGPTLEHNLPFRSDLPLDLVVDAIVDFSSSEGLDAALEIALSRKIALVSGSTGIDLAQQARLRDASKYIPVLWSANFSLGVALLKQLVALAAARLGPEFDAEVFEVHHRYKKDAPSGTALALGDAIAKARGSELSDLARYSRAGNDAARKAGEIGFAVSRAADIVGEHTVLFASEGERIELTHRAGSRAIFASGAVRSAIWLARQPAGLYEVADVLL